MSDQEQEEVIKQLRDKVVKIDTKKPSKIQKREEDDILEKAKEAGETIDDDDTVPPRDIQRP